MGHCFVMEHFFSKAFETVGPIFLKVIMVLAAIVAPIKAVIFAVGFLVFADLIMGVWAAKKRGETINSAGLRRSVSKLLVYQLSILSAFAVETYLVTDLIPMVKVLAATIAMVELKSIIESANVILGQDIFKTVLKQLGSKNDNIDPKQ